MRAIVNVARGRLEMREMPLPRPSRGQVRIRTCACGICATDLAMIAGWSRTPLGAVPGHEWSGVVDAVGAGVDAALVGRACVAENVLPDGGEVGFEHPGGYAECFLTEAANLQMLPDGFPFAAATLIEPLAVCVRGLRRLGETPARALIFGDGPVGLLMVVLLAGGGSEVLLVGGRQGRLKLARDLGASAVFDYHTMGADLAARLVGEAGPALPAVIEASGSPAALKAAMRLVRGGRILVVGDYGAACADFPWNTILHREITMVGSNASAGAWPEAVRLAGEHRAMLEKFVTHIVPAADFARGIELVRDRASGAVKVVLQWR